MLNWLPNTEMRKQQRFFLYSPFMFCPLLWLSQREAQPLSGHKDPSPQDIKTFLCTDCLLTITSLSQLSVNRTSQPLAWELLIRDAHPQTRLLLATTQGAAALGQQQASLGPVSSLPQPGRGRRRGFLQPCAMAAVCSPFGSAPNSHSYGHNSLIAKSTPCHSDLCPTTVMSCDQAEKSKGCFPYRSPSAEILHPLAVPLYKWLSKT